LGKKTDAKHAMDAMNAFKRKEGILIQRRTGRAISMPHHKSQTVTAVTQSGSQTKYRINGGMGMDIGGRGYGQYMRGEVEWEFHSDSLTDYLFRTQALSGSVRERHLRI